MSMLKVYATIARMKVREFFTKEDGAVDIVAIVILIGIAVLLAVFFKDATANLLKGLFDNINNSANKALQPI